MPGYHGGTYTLRMSLKSAALVALIGMLLLTLVVAVDFLNTVAADIRGLVPAVKVLTSFVELVATLGLSVFLFVFHRNQR